MKKKRKKMSIKLKIAIFIFLNFTLMLVPLKSMYSDGGTTTYDAFLYKIIDHDTRIIYSPDPYTEIKHGKEIFISPNNWIFNGTLKEHIYILIINLIIFLIFVYKIIRKNNDNIEETNDKKEN